MVSYLHELLLLLFRNRSEVAAELLRELAVEIPEYDEVLTESSDLSDLRPAEYRADLVLFLMRESRKALGVILEVQLRRDENKSYSWPAYIANLRARHRCPVCLLVITMENSVARWADKPIELGPGTCCTPLVLGPSNTPVVMGLDEANRNVELAVLSAVEHENDTDAQLATHIESVALVAIAGVDAERLEMYSDLIFEVLGSAMRKS